MKKFLFLVITIMMGSTYGFSSSVSDAIQDQIDRETSSSSQKISSGTGDLDGHIIEEETEQEGKGLIQIIGDVIEHGQTIIEDPQTQEVIKTKGPKVIQFFKDLLCAGKTGADDEPKKSSKKKKKKNKK